MLSREDLNFLITNRIPRAAATRFIGWLSHIQSPLLATWCIAIWRLFTSLDLSESKKQRFDSLHDCFIRELKSGARPLDTRPDMLVSPCDGIIGAYGRIDDGQVFQAKGFPYRIKDLLIHEDLVDRWQSGHYITLRITSAMYHRFHAPHNGQLHRVRYISGDTWNVNPIALKRIESLFCKNERAVLEMSLGPDRTPVVMVPIAAILVASIRIHGIQMTLNHRARDGLTVSSDQHFEKGQELGWFEHGSTIVMFVPEAFAFDSVVYVGQKIRMGQTLMRLPTPCASQAGR
ncbi:MAG: hypothetical protein RLZZ281_871 [Pseudomonadota bacterium]